MKEKYFNTLNELKNNNELHLLANEEGFTQELSIEGVRLYLTEYGYSEPIEQALKNQLKIGFNTQGLTEEQLKNGLFIIDTEYPDLLIYTRDTTCNAVLLLQAYAQLEGLAVDVKGHKVRGNSCNALSRPVFWLWLNKSGHLTVKTRGVQKSFKKWRSLEDFKNILQGFEII